MSNLFSRLSLRANIVTAAMAAFLLAACGGDGNKANEPAPSAEADFVVDTFGDLSVCTGNREGATAYVKDEDNAYICTDGDWAIDTNVDTRKKSSSSKDNTQSSSSRHCEDCKDEAISSNKDDVKSSSSVIPKSSDSETSVSSSSTKSSYSSAKADGSEYDAIANMLKDLRDGQTYKTVKIGDQVWMAENLNYKIDNSWCGGGHDTTEGDCSKYGRFYTWAAAIDSAKLYNDKSISIDCGYGHTCGLSGRVRGACPEGWHLPDTTEWKTLFDAVGGIDVAGKMLKSQTGWKDSNGASGNGTDAYGFSAFPAGDRLRYGFFYYEGRRAYFWSATEDFSTSAYIMSLGYNSENADLSTSYKYDAFSVRCLKDDP